MSDGTPIVAIENGEVTDAADSQHMQSILAEMNASGADIANGPAVEAPPMRQPMPQMMYNPQPPQPVRQYIEQPIHVVKPNQTNVIQRLFDPLVVSVIIFVLSLPVLHTYAGRYASWAFAIGGQLSWIGLITLSLVGGALFGIVRASRDILGL